jgi:hypothetical protein
MEESVTPPPQPAALLVSDGAVKALDFSQKLFRPANGTAEHLEQESFAILEIGKTVNSTLHAHRTSKTRGARLITVSVLPRRYRASRTDFEARMTG